MPALNYEEVAERIVQNEVAAMARRDMDWAAETRIALKKAIVDAMNEAAGEIALHAQSEAR